ncbi:hypothetical protein KKA94_03365 [Patescibacteria group bacterium]|nr:hypothetical protein [Patescibacteria group bacterium]
MKKMLGKFIFWTPRILSIVFICFLVVFSFDVFEMELSFWQTTGALFMHNLPSLILLAVLIISWKHEIVGAITFILAGLLYILLLLMRGWYHWSGLLLIALPAFLIGILFLLGWFKKRKITRAA